MQNNDFVRRFQSPGGDRIISRVMHIDLILFVLLLILCVFGLVVIYSAGGQDLFYVKRQFVFMIAGFILMLLVAQFPARSWERWAFVFYGFGLVLLAAVLIFGVEPKAPSAGSILVLPDCSLQNL